MKRIKRRKNKLKGLLTLFLLVTFITASLVYVKISNRKDSEQSTFNQTSDSIKTNNDSLKTNNASPSINDELLESILEAYPEKFKNVLDNKDKYDVQILYTQINRNTDGTITFTKNGFNLDKNDYFYPASSVKLAATIVALDKLNNLNIPGLNKYTSLEVLSGRESESGEDEDFTAKNGKPSIAQYIKKVLVTSDNDAFNRLYEFIGQETLNETLWNKGYKDILIRQRIGDGPMTEENRYTNPFVFYDSNGKVIYEQPLVYNSTEYTSLVPKENTLKGRMHEEDGDIIDGPHDFSESNYASIETLQELMKAVIFPQSIPENKRFNLKDDDIVFLKKYMSMLPRQCTYPSYDLPDNYAKFFMYGSTNKSIPSNIKIYNKIGNANGYLIDNAYINDTKNNIEFFLTAVIFSNEDGIFADSHFNEDKIGMPFLTELGNTIYKYERNGRVIKK